MYSHIVFAEGYKGMNNPYFDWLDYRISRGDVVDFSSPVELPEHILNREKWILPFTKDTGRTGSSYAWEDIEKEPDPNDALHFCPHGKINYPDSNTLGSHSTVSGFGRARMIPNHTSGPTPAMRVFVF